MALCPSCGKNIDDSCSFCSACGAKIVNETPQTGKYNISNREGALALMNDVKNLYNLLSDDLAMVVALKNENEKMKKGWKNKAWVVFMILACSFTLLSIIASIATLSPEGLIVALVYGVPFAILFLVFYRKNKQGIKKQIFFEKNEEVITAKTDEILSTYYQQELSNYYSLDYFYEDAIDMLIRYLSQFRADSLKDALNLFETEAHQRRLEDQQQKIIFTQKEILNQAKQTAKAATASAVFSGISAYNSVKMKNDINEINSKL